MTSRSLEEHRADVVALLSPLAPLNMSLADAVGCVSVGNYVAPRSVPPLPLAAGDGFAVSSADTKGARLHSVTLPVTHDALPGGSPTRLARGGAVRIARGAALPFGADAVVLRAEGTPVAVTVDTEATAGVGVVLVGHEISEGDTVVAEGTRLTAGHVAALAACGAVSVMVRPAPRVVIIAVGSELRPHNAPRTESSAVAEPIADATGPMLSVLFGAAGARVVRVTTVADDAPALRSTIDDAALQADLVVTAGGLSTAWSDVVGPVLSHAFGVQIRAVRMEPGTRHGLGTIGQGDGRPVVLLAMPGHPVGAAAAFAAYAADAVATLRGGSPARVQAVAAESWASPFGFAHVVPIVRTVHGDGAQGEGVRAGGVGVAPVGDPAQPTLRNLAAADGLCLIPEAVTRVHVGDTVEVLWWSP